MPNFLSCYSSAAIAAWTRFNRDSNNASESMAQEIFGIAAVFWVLIPIGLAGGALLLKLQGD